MPIPLDLCTTEDHGHLQDEAVRERIFTLRSSGALVKSGNGTALAGGRSLLFAVYP
jgi:hypothetical protein